MSRKVSPEGFHGACLGCGGKGLWQVWSPVERRGQAGEGARIPAAVVSRASTCVVCRRTPSVVLVEGSVDGQPCRLTIDTGAKNTLVRPDMLVAKCFPDAPQRLCSITGDCVELKGPVEA